MMEESITFLHQQKLKTSIDTLRDILNELCCYTIDEREVNIEKLSISQQLDTLIVEYMGLENSNSAFPFIIDKDALNS